MTPIIATQKTPEGEDQHRNPSGKIIPLIMNFSK